jgi:hypothetical protein
LADLRDSTIYPLLTISNFRREAKYPVAPPLQTSETRCSNTLTHSFGKQWT